MERNYSAENRYSLLNLAIIIILMYIPAFLLSKELHMLVSIYVVLISVWLIKMNRKTIARNVRFFFIERKKLKKLEYYHITDDNKVIDLERRRNTFSLFRDITMGTLFISIVNFMAIHNLIQHFFGESAILNLLTMIIISLVVFIGYGGMIAGIVYKYTTTIYVAIPAISAIIYFSSLDPLIYFFPDFARFAGYLFTSIILYFVLTYTLPVYILRKLNSKTILISSFTTILATFSSQILLFYFSSYIQTENYLLTMETVKNATDVSNTLKSIILDTPELIEVYNHFLMKESSNVLTSMTSLVVTALTISYIVGGLIINRKISKDRLKAKSIYRKLIKEECSIDYRILIECSFHGGEEYENLLLNNDVTSKIIIENETALKIPDISIKTRFIAWWKRTSIVYSAFSDIKRDVWRIRN